MLPDHVPCIWTLPEGDDETRWRQLKAAFSRQLAKNERRSKSRVHKGERGIWQRRFWEHAIRDDAHYPVRHGYVTQVAEWRYSSFHRFLRLGIYLGDWAGPGLQEMESVGREYRFRYALLILPGLEFLP